MGRVIGKGGESINEIRRMSGCTVDIQDMQPGASMRVITITGTPEQTQVCQYLVQIKMAGGQMPSVGELSGGAGYAQAQPSPYGYM